jgi:nucleotide-binding universal stress UspA family protein
MKTLDAKIRIQLNNILFATDFSPAAAAALPYAASLAKRFGANLFAMHVRTPVINPMTPPAGWPALEKAAEEEERERRESLRNSIPGVPITILIEEGDIFTNLRAVMQRKAIDLLVIGTRGRSGIGKLLLGSAAEEIFREAPCPVLTVGPHAPAQPNGTGEFTRILYATSFGSESAAAAPYAISLAQEYQAKLTLLHVLEDSRAGDLVIPQELVESSKRRLASLVPPEAELWCTPGCCVERGEVAVKILDVAKDQKADLIVLGVHQPSGVPGAATHLAIATAHKVVSHAHCPVLTVRD